MAKKKKRSGNKRFFVGLIIYAVVFLAIAAGGLSVFWKYIEAYELSRPKNTLDAYLEQLTAEDMCQGAQELLEQIDESLQSREESRQVIRDAVAEKLSYAKKSAESTDNRQVYALRCGKQVIGTFAITAGDADMFGFQAWEVTEERFDFSYLLSQDASITVPSDFAVSFNGKALEEGYIVESGIQYSALEEYYDDYELPTMVTYSVGTILGEASFTVTDREGNLVEITEETDMNSLLPTCTETEAKELDAFVAKFLQSYVTFTGSANGHASSNYVKLKEYLVPEGDLVQRLHKALDGLQYAQSGGDNIDEIIVNRDMPMDDNRYLCDVTYLVTTRGKKGAVQTTNNMKIIVLDTDDGLKVEAITSY